MGGAREHMKRCLMMLLVLAACGETPAPPPVPVVQPAPAVQPAPQPAALVYTLKIEGMH